MTMPGRLPVSCVLLLVLAAALAGLGPAAANHGPSEKTFAKVPSVGGHEVPITIYRPLGADADHKVPVLLHSHGWSGSRETADGAFHGYVAAGFGVVSIDMRGHGEARTTSEARVHHVDFEIQDVRAVIDHVATLPWVLLDAPGDPRLGSIGGSYGGGYQLLTAALDDRLDALAPEITWNDLVQSLAPNGAPKTAWVDLLYGAGNAFARVHPDIHAAYAYVQATNRIPDGSVPGTPDIESQFGDSSPASYPGAIGVPTLLVQGMPDTLFNFNEAAANYAQIKATGAPVRLVTHLGGHILNTNGTIPVPSPVSVGLQPPKGPSPCGSYTDQAVSWFRKHLQQENVTTGPEVCLALDDGSTVTGTAFPLPNATLARVALPGAATILQGPPAPETSFTVLTATQPTVIAGIPHLSGLALSALPDYIVYWKLVVVDGNTGEARVLSAQVTPMRAVGPPSQTTRFELDLSGVATRLQPGDTLRLVVANWNEQYLHNGGRLPGTVAVGGLRLDLPLL